MKNIYCKANLNNGLLNDMKRVDQILFNKEVKENNLDNIVGGYICTELYLYDKREDIKSKNTVSFLDFYSDFNREIAYFKFDVDAWGKFNYLYSNFHVYYTCEILNSKELKSKYNLMTHCEIRGLDDVNDDVKIQSLLSIFESIDLIHFEFGRIDFLCKSNKNNSIIEAISDNHFCSFGNIFNTYKYFMKRFNMSLYEAEGKDDSPYHYFLVNNDLDVNNVTFGNKNFDSMKPSNNKLTKIDSIDFSYEGKYLVYDVKNNKFSISQAITEADNFVYMYKNEYLFDFICKVKENSLELRNEFFNIMESKINSMNLSGDYFLFLPFSFNHDIPVDFEELKECTEENLKNCHDSKILITNSKGKVDKNKFGWVTDVIKVQNLNSKRSSGKTAIANRLNTFIRFKIYEDLGIKDKKYIRSLKHIIKNM